MIYTATKAGFAKLAQQNLLAPETWASVYEFITKSDFNAMELGKYELAGGAYAALSEYTTRESSHFENHKKFIDIQMLSKGEEYIDMAAEGVRIEVLEYNEAKDIEKFDLDQSDLILLNADNLAVIFPGEPHKPCMAVNEPVEVRKIVIKIPYIE